jgi:hypothetical protein
LLGLPPLGVIMKFSNLNLDKKIKRKKFFVAAAASVVTYSVLSSFPFNLLFGNKENKKVKSHKSDRIKVNPLAVSREN